MTDSVPVFVIFKVFGEGDGNSCFDMVSLASTLEEATDWIAADYAKDPRFPYRDYGVDGVHKDMNKENNYTYVGKRTDCNSECDYSGFGGYVVEQMSLLVKRQRPEEETNVGDIDKNGIEIQIETFLSSNKMFSGIKLSQEQIANLEVGQRLLGIDLSKVIPHGWSPELQMCTIEHLVEYYKRKENVKEVKYVFSDNGTIGNLLFTFC